MVSTPKPSPAAATTNSFESPIAQRPHIVIPPRKKLGRRKGHNYSQQLRLGFQLAFVALNVWIGIRFYQWVRWAETAGALREVTRPAGVEGWLPIAGLMQFKYVLVTHEIPHIHPAGFFLFVAFLLMSFLLRKSFCSWLCPIGTFSEYLWKLGRSTFHRNFTLPRWLDLPLRSLKYLLLGLFGYAVFSMSTESIAEFLTTPYGLIVDVRMLNFFRYLDGLAAYTVLGLAIASLFVQNFWCRHMCPYGAFLGLAALASPLRITRRESSCIDCAKCAKACPSSLAVDKLVQIRSAECTACLECVAVCPAKDTLFVSTFPTRRAIPVWAFAAAIAVIFFGLVGYAKLSGHWDTRLPREVYFRLVPAAGDQGHP